MFQTVTFPGLVSEMGNGFVLRRSFPFKLKQWTLIISIVSILFGISFASSIDNLEGNAGFRMATLRWTVPPEMRGSTAFRVRYCESHVWGLHRCRYQTVNDVSISRHGGRGYVPDERKVENIEVDVPGLRMSTNYTFQVIPLFQQPLNKFDGQSSPSQISLQTKGFSANASKCLADSSEVIVETGPFFGGRISVEDSSTPGCFIKGNPQSPQTKYVLKIRHKECGSSVDGSKVTSMIVVQENVPILTHSTRRFVVVCSVSPDSFVVKAGVSLPRETSVAKSLDFNPVVSIAPEQSNSLNGDFDYHLQSQSQQNLIQSSSQNDGRGYYVSHLYAERSPTAESRAVSDKLERGMLETFLVFGMICAAIVAGMVSVVWFIRSYWSVSSAHQETIRRITAEDLSDANSSLSFDSGSLSLSDASCGENLESAEPEVEVDFEFSEDINRESIENQGEVTLNISLHNSSFA